MLAASHLGPVQVHGNTSSCAIGGGVSDVELGAAIVNLRFSPFSPVARFGRETQRIRRSRRIRRFTQSITPTDRPEHRREVKRRSFCWRS